MVGLSGIQMAFDLFLTIQIPNELFRSPLYLLKVALQHFFFFRPDHFDKSVDFYQLSHRTISEHIFKSVTIQADAKEENLRVDIFFLKQWGSEHHPFEYRKHLNTKLFEVRISNGSPFKWSVYVLCLMY